MKTQYIKMHEVRERIPLKKLFLAINVIRHTPDNDMSINDRLYSQHRSPKIAVQLKTSC